MNEICGACQRPMAIHEEGRLGRVLLALCPPDALRGILYPLSLVERPAFEGQVRVLDQDRHLSRPWR